MNENTKNIKNVLEEANRYEDVISIINHIIKDYNALSYPVNPFIYKGSIKNSVDGKMVRKEASNILKSIEENEYDLKSDDFLNLHRYVKSHANDLLHNFAVSISHRVDPIIDIDIIRSWMILDNLIDNLDIINNYDNDHRWYIPKGWMKI